MSSQIVSFASGSAPVRSRDAVRHGVLHEASARHKISRACGIWFHPVEEVASLHLGDVEVRVKPDGATDIVPQRSTAILEIKCPFSKNMRNQIGSRMSLHARQCLCELIAFPEAAFLIFAVLNYAPGEETSNRNYDSVLHRLDRASAVDALDELRAVGLLRAFAKDELNPRVDAVLERMVSTAVPLPKVSRMKTAKAIELLPELFREIPRHLVDHIAKAFRHDDDVLDDCSRVAAVGAHFVDGIPICDLPRYFLRFSARVALHRFCQHHLPEQADSMLGRCCLSPSDVKRAQSWLSYKESSLPANVVFDIARREQNKPRGSSIRNMCGSNSQRSWSCRRGAIALSDFDSNSKC